MGQANLQTGRVLTSFVRGTYWVGSNPETPNRYFVLGVSEISKLWTATDVATGKVYRPPQLSAPLATAGLTYLAPGTAITITAE